jgi:hypothetical protein
MHHKEIGQFVHYFSKYLSKEQDLYPVKIETVLVNPSMVPFDEISLGIRLTSVVQNSRITIEIDNYQQDSNETKIFYYSELDKPCPSLSLIHPSSDLNFADIEPTIKVLVEVAKGNMCLRTLRSLTTIGSFRVQ